MTDLVKREVGKYCLRYPRYQAVVDRLALRLVRLDCSRVVGGGYGDPVIISPDRSYTPLLPLTGVVAVHGTKAQWAAFARVMACEQPLVTVEWSPISRAEAKQNRRLAQYIDAAAKHMSDEAWRRYKARQIQRASDVVAARGEA